MISRQLMVSELESVQALVGAWIAVLKGESGAPGYPSMPGIPAEDFPASQDKRVECYQQLSGELVICASKCETLADVIHNATR